MAPWLLVFTCPRNELLAFRKVRHLRLNFNQREVLGLVELSRRGFLSVFFRWKRWSKHRLRLGDNHNWIEIDSALCLLVKLMRIWILIALLGWNLDVNYWTRGALRCFLVWLNLYFLMLKKFKFVVFSLDNNMRFDLLLTKLLQESLVLSFKSADISLSKYRFVQIFLMYILGRILYLVAFLTYNCYSFFFFSILLFYFFKGFKHKTAFLVYIVR